MEEDGCPILTSGQLYSLKKTPDLSPEDEDDLFIIWRAGPLRMKTELTLHVKSFFFFF